MTKFLLTAGALAMAIAGPALAEKGENGKGKDKGKGGSVQMNSDHGQGNIKIKSKGGGDIVQIRDKRGRGDDAVVRIDRDRVRIDRDRVIDRVVDRRDRRNDDRFDDDDRDFVRFANGRGLIDGCPPGLAKKNNGCLPPGKARAMFNGDDRYARWFNAVPSRYRDDYDDYSYRDGYLYRSSSDGISGWLPLLGGALGVGELFPVRYRSFEMPQAYDDYYARDDDYDYRYADGAIFAVDPQTQLIRSIAALVTGDEWVVGEEMPLGYDAYNVPLDYRDEYADSDEWNYRYADGNVYRVDPTTQLISAVISLLT